MAVDRAGGQSSLARICGITQPAIWKMLQSSKRLGAEYVLKVEASTGVPGRLLRPDIYPLETPSLPTSTIAEPTPLCGPILSARTLGRHGKTHGNLDSRGEAA